MNEIKVFFYTNKSTSVTNDLILLNIAGGSEL